MKAPSSPSFFRSIRWQIQAWHGILLAVIVAGLLISFYHYERRERLARLDVELQDVRLRLLPGLQGNGPPGGGERDGPPGEPGEGRGGDSRHQDAQRFRSKLGQTSYYFLQWAPDGNLMESSSNAPAEAPMPSKPGPNPKGPGQFRTRGEFRELIHLGPESFTLVLGVSQAGVMQALRGLAWKLTLLWAGIVTIGLAGGWWLAGRALRPIAAISSTARQIAGGDLSGRIPINETESELGELAGVLNDTFQRLDHAFAQQRRFTADASHELRTPVTVILSQTQLALSKKRGAEEYEHALDICRRNAESMRTLVNSLMELAHIDADKEELLLETHDLASVVADAVELIRPLAEEQHISLRMEMEASPCHMDRETIRRVIINLLTNAIRYNRPDGSITVRVRPGGKTVVLTVTDTGTGISGEHLPHIFDRFYRTDKARSRAHGGAGLGLAICQSLVRANGGTIQAKSVLGEGSVFTVELPVVSSIKA